MPGGKHRGHNEGTYYRLPSGRWRAQVTVDGRRLSAYRDTRQAAIEWIRETLGQVKKGMTFEGARTPFGEFTAYYLQSTQGVMKPRTWEYYKSLADKYIIPAMGAVRLKDLRAEHVQGLYNAMQSQGKSPFLINKIHALIHQVCQHATHLGLVPVNPASRVLVPRIPDEELRILDESEVSRLLLAAKGTRHEALIHLAVTTGMRMGELLGLKWDDIDWVARSVRVERQLLRDYRFDSPKTRHGRRVVALGERSVEILRAHRERLDLERAAQPDRWHDTGLVFPNTIGTPMDHANLRLAFKKMLEQAGLPPVRFHDLRHTAAALMLNHGVPVIVVSRRLGHSRASITLDLYGHLVPGFQEAAAEKMDSLVTPVEIEVP